jgi:transcriptional regulator with XRE-family HTH domain
LARRSKELDIGKRIAAIRLQKALSQGLVSRRAGIDPSYLSRVENGKVHPTVRTAMRIAGALRVTADDLFGPSPPEVKGQLCPVTKSGQCLLDMIDRREASDGEAPMSFTPRQVRLLRRFTSLVGQSDPKLLTALDVLMQQLLNERKPPGKRGGRGSRG